MSTKETGGPAFPVPNLQDDESFNGMSLRDYFAAKALQAMIGNTNKEGTNCGAGGVKFFATCAYEFADAMLAERAK